MNSTHGMTYPSRRGVLRALVEDVDDGAISHLHEAKESDGSRGSTQGRPSKLCVGELGSEVQAATTGRARRAGADRQGKKQAN